MKKVVVYFHETKHYGEIVFEAKTAYELVDTKDDFIGRWARRGCDVESKAKEFLPDPRFPIEKVKQVVKEAVKKIEKKIIETVKPKVEDKPVKEVSKKVEKDNVAIQKPKNV